MAIARAEQRQLAFFPGVWVIAKRELQDQLRDWRIVAPIVILTLFFPLLMDFTARQASDFVARYGANPIGERLLPFLLMIVGFFPISISLVIALESFAGERERLSLEPLLATPLRDSQLYLGKLLASLALPLCAAYLGIAVYLTGLALRLNWYAPPELLVQVILLSAAQAVVMVSGAVVISSQATSVRSANLMASFIIVPVSELIIGESLIMFWARYSLLWWILLGLVVLAFLLGRMGMYMLNREDLLNREIDSLDLRAALGLFWRSFSGQAASLGAWYRNLLGVSLPQTRHAVLIMTLAIASGVAIGTLLARQFRLPVEALTFTGLGEESLSYLRDLGMLSARGWIWVVVSNIRAVLLAAFMGLFSFGVLGVVLLMVPMGLVGYFAANVALAGGNVLNFLGGLVLPHALLEVPAAILAGAAILRLGMTFVTPPQQQSLGEHWLTSLGEWAKINVGLVLPLLLGAAAIEVFLTPRIAVLLLAGP